MKTASAFVLAVSVAAASASLSPRQIDQIPQCALQCALGQITSTGCASQTDFKCICEASSFVAGLVPCVQKACTAAEYEQTVKAAQGLCLAAGVTLSVPSGPASTSAASSAATSSMPATMTSEMSSMMTSESSMMSSMMSSEVSTMATTTAAGTTRSPNATVTTSTPSATGSPGAASRNTVALSGLGAILALVAALL